jgi:hypothetical protein
MGNMSYCRFENTFNDLDDCYTSLGEKTFDELSDTEKKYALRLVHICRNIADDFMDEVEDIENAS